MIKSDDDEAMELRIATIYYKNFHKKITSAQLKQIASLPGERTALPKFILGESNEKYAGYERLKQFLTEKGYFPLKNNTSSGISHSSFASFFENHSKDSTNKYLKRAKGKYECFQWSSTESGKVIVSMIEINHDDSNDFASAIEKQFFRRGELFEGFCIYSDKRINIILREEMDKRPKFIICDEVHPDYISGIYLKSSTRKRIHISGIYMIRVEGDIVPRIEYIDNIHEEARGHLEEPLTSFYLTSDEDLDDYIKGELKIALSKFHKKNNAK